jgi:hypothetical protein
MLSYTVSQLDVFRDWQDREDLTLDALIADLRGIEPTHAMKRGLAFHKALELACEGEVDTVTADGFTFNFDGNFEIPLMPYREIRGQKIYDGLEVRSRLDGLQGKVILDHKASTYFDAERYLRKYAWRFYLDIFDADLFRWFIWDMTEDRCDEFIYTVHDLHILEQFRYPELERHCAELAGRFKVFAEQYLVPQMVGQ